MVAPPEYSSGLNPTKIGSSTDSSIIPNSCVGLIGRGQPFARVEVLGSRISPEANAVADGVLHQNSIGVVLLKPPPRRCPFLALWKQQRQANGGKLRHKAKVQKRSISRVRMHVPTRQSKGQQSAANDVCS